MAWIAVPPSFLGLNKRKLVRWPTTNVVDQAERETLDRLKVAAER